MELLEFEFLEISPEGRGLAMWGLSPRSADRALARTGRS